MGGLLLIGLLIVLLVKLWPLVVAALACWALWCFGLAPAREARAKDRRERLRHAQARRDIDRIATQASRAMYAAASDGEVTNGTGVEVRSG